MSTLRVMRYAFLSGLYDYATIYTWKSWLGGWFLRVLAQVSFFALIGRLLGDQEQIHFLLVGNATMLAAMEGLFALNMVSWERSTGTLPLLAASPTGAVTVLASRGVYLVVDGSVSALGALFILGPVFGLPLPWPRVMLIIPLTILVGVSAYCLGTFLGGVVLGYRSMNNVIVNVGLVAIMAMCGVNVPIGSYPAAVRYVSACLPVTHGLQAIRDVLAGSMGDAGRQALLEAAVGATWLALCLITFRWFVFRGRRNGSLDFGV
jgi:ABC-2 type transport system permease protein